MNVLADLAKFERLGTLKKCQQSRKQPTSDNNKDRHMNNSIS